MTSLYRLFATNTTALIHAYVPVSAFKVSPRSLCPGEEEGEGMGEEGDIFPLNCPILFKITEQKGSNVTFVYKFGYSVDGREVMTSQFDEESDLVETVHVFTAPPTTRG